MEREIKERPAGLRTIILITLGATIFMIVSDLIAIATDGPEAITRVDTSRIASQVVTGIGFLGAGAIIRTRGAIRGLTTAATIWVAASIGLCIGVGFPMLGFAITLVVLGVLVALEPISTSLNRRGRKKSLNLILPNDALTLRRVRNVLRENDILEQETTLESMGDNRLMLSFSYQTTAGELSLLEELSSIDDVKGDTKIP
jgi:putative Mg2+ transporter-C (MgtC) family protein